jgi:hypothetical protein
MLFILLGSQDSHNATRDYKKLSSGGFSPTEEDVDGEQKEAGIDACDPSQLRAKREVGCDSP